MDTCTIWYTWGEGKKRRKRYIVEEKVQCFRGGRDWALCEITDESKRYGGVGHGRVV